MSGKIDHEPSTVHRRGFLDGVAGVALLASWSALIAGCAARVEEALPLAAPAPPRAVAAPLVDVHCHIFNACDIPIEGFTDEVLLRDSPAKQIPQLDLLKYVVELLRCPAPMACAESANLPETISYSYDAKAQLGDDRKSLTAFLQAVYVGGPQPCGIHRPLVTPLALHELEGYLKSSLKKKPKHDAALDILAKLDSHSTPSDCQKAASAIYALDPASSLVAAKLIWLMKFSRSRVGLLLELDSLFDAARNLHADVPDQFRFYTPALVDFDYWVQPPEVDDNAQPGLCTNTLAAPAIKHSRISEQVVVMSEIARRQPPGRAVFAFVPYDPLRDVVDDGRTAGHSGFDVVRDAIENRGLIGVKLYPPMGFQPTDNALIGDGLLKDQAEKYFGPQVAFRAKFGSLALKYPTVEEFGRALDEKLFCLYDYCLKYDVPIMAHCSKSQESFTAAAGRASPRNWAKLLTQDNHKYARLRLNLAHFGGVWCLGYASSKHKDELDPICEKPDPHHPHNQWTDFAITMATAEFPNLHFDIADWAEVEEADTGTAEAFAALKDACQRNNELGRRIMYGTDWSMLGQYAGQDRYCDTIYANSVASFGPRVASDMMGRNALRFLGLIGDACTSRASANAPTWPRLRAFLSQTKVGKAKADELDAYFQSICVPATS